MFGGGFMSDMVAKNKQNLSNLKNKTFFKLGISLNNTDNSNRKRLSDSFYKNRRARKREYKAVMFITRSVLTAIVLFLLIRIFFY